MDKAFGIFDIELFFLVGYIDKDHEVGNGCVKLELLNLLCDRLDRFMVDLVQSSAIFSDQLLRVKETINPIKELTAAF